MIRTVLAVVLAVALLSVSLPAVEDAAAHRSAERLRADLSTLADAAEGLVAHNDALRGAGARAFVTVRVPDRGWAAAAGAVHVGRCPGIADPTGRDRLCFSVGDGPPRAVETGVDVRGTDGPLRLGGGRHRLRLRLAKRDGRPVVFVAEV